MSTSKPAKESLLPELKLRLATLVPRQSKVVLAVSGGPDSTALLIAWAELAKKREDHLHVAHFDHRLRESSSDDADFVVELAKSLALPCTIGVASQAIDNTGGSLEANARDARYRFLVETATAIGARHVATGHSADDQVETVLFSIVRGTGLHGLAGMPNSRPLNDQVTLIRPLLTTRRVTIHRYLEEAGIAARCDESNQDPRYSRNRVRNDLLPFLRETFNPRVDEAILRLSEQAEGATRIVDRLAQELLAEAIVHSDPTSVLLSVKAIRLADPYLVRAALRRHFEKVNWPRQALGHTELQRISELIHADAGRAWELPGGIRAQRVARPCHAIKLTYTPGERLIGE